MGKVWRPYSLLESDPVCSVTWHTMGLAIESTIEVQNGEVISPPPHDEGLRLSHDDGNRTKREGRVVADGAGIT